MLARLVGATYVYLGEQCKVIATNDTEEIKRPELVGAAKSPWAVWEEDEKSREREREG